MFAVARCAEFITSFQDVKLKPDPIHSKLKYMIEMVSLCFEAKSIISKEWLTVSLKSS